MHTTNVQLPVYWQGGGGHTAQVMLVDVEVPSLTEDEAQDVEISATSQRDHEIYKYRSHGGMLWEEVPIPATGHYPIENLLRRSFAQDIYNELRERMFWIPPAHKCSPKLLRLAEELIQPLSQDFSIIGGRLHSRSFGPLYIVGRFGGITERPYLSSTNAYKNYEHPRNAHMVFSVLLSHRALPMLERLLPRLGAPHTHFATQASIEPEPDLIAASAERALWSFLWYAHHLKNGMSHDLAEITLDIREFLKQRWPSLDMEPSDEPMNYYAPHLLRRNLPPAQEVQPLLQRITEYAARNWAPGISGTYQFVSEMVDILAPIPHNLDEHEELKGFRI